MKNALLTLSLILISGCGHDRYIVVPIDLPPKLVVPSLTDVEYEKLQCVPPEILDKLILRDKMRRAFEADLVARIKKHNEISKGKQ